MNHAQLSLVDAGRPVAALGYVPDPQKGRGETPDYPAHEVLGVDPYPEAASAAELFLGLLNQSPLNSCVAFAGFYAVEASMLRQGVPPEKIKRLSRLYGYLASRLLHGARDEDQGTHIRLFFEACAKAGFTTEEAWPYLMDFVEGVERWRATPDDDARRIAADALGRVGVNYHRVTEQGPARMDAICRAVSQKRWLVGGFQVSVDFARNRHAIGDYLDPPLNMPIAGGHALAICEYDALGVRGPNSWDDEGDVRFWGERGWFRFGWDYVVDPRFAWDFWIVEAAPLMPGQFGLLLAA